MGWFNRRNPPKNVYQQMVDNFTETDESFDDNQKSAFKYSLGMARGIFEAKYGSIANFASRPQDEKFDYVRKHNIATAQIALKDPEAGLAFSLLGTWLASVATGDDEAAAISSAFMKHAQSY